MVTKSHTFEVYKKEWAQYVGKFLFQSADVVTFSTEVGFHILKRFLSSKTLKVLKLAQY